MSSKLAVKQSFLREFTESWLCTMKAAGPVFLRLLPMYIAITLVSSITAVAVLLVLGKAAFHLACMFSPLIFILIGMAIDRQSGSDFRASLPAAWLPLVLRFWRYTAPIALAIALILNFIFLFAMILGDLGAWRAGALPNLNFPADLFTSQKLPLLLMLLTTATEQQLVFMPFLVVLGGRLEPHMVGLVIAGRYTLDSALGVQAALSKREKFVLAPMRLLVMLGVSLQFMAKDISDSHMVFGKVLLLSSYFGWLMYVCMLACIAQRYASISPKIINH
jgi:hypothetical protein